MFSEVFKISLKIKFKVFDLIQKHPILKVFENVPIRHIKIKMAIRRAANGLDKI